MSTLPIPPLVPPGPVRAGQIACRAPECPRYGQPAGYVDDGTDAPRGGPCPTCQAPTDPPVEQLGHGYCAAVTVDGHGRPNGWAIFNPAGEYLDEAHNLASAAAFAEDHARLSAPLIRPVASTAAEVGSSAADFMVAIWAPPGWAARSAVQDGAVVHQFESSTSALIAPMIVGQEAPAIGVELSQADELEVDEFGAAKVVRADPVVMIDALQLTVAEARKLQAALGEVLAVAVGL